LLAKGGFRVSCDCENKEEIFGGYLRVRGGGGVGGERVRIKNHEKRVEREKLEEREREREMRTAPLCCVYLFEQEKIKKP
jgi:hypothetical protein